MSALLCFSWRFAPLNQSFDLSVDADRLLWQSIVFILVVTIQLMIKEQREKEWCIHKKKEVQQAEWSDWPFSILDVLSNEEGEHKIIIFTFQLLLKTTLAKLLQMLCFFFLLLLPAVLKVFYDDANKHVQYNEANDKQERDEKE